jgi:hypothetical protein
MSTCTVLHPLLSQALRNSNQEILSWNEPALKVFWDRVLTECLASPDTDIAKAIAAAKDHWLMTREQQTNAGGMEQLWEAATQLVTLVAVEMTRRNRSWLKEDSTLRVM